MVNLSQLYFFPQLPGLLVVGCCNSWSGLRAWGLKITCEDFSMNPRFLAPLTLKPQTGLLGSAGSWILSGNELQLPRFFVHTAKPADSGLPAFPQIKLNPGSQFWRPMPRRSPFWASASELKWSWALHSHCLKSYWNQTSWICVRPSGQISWWNRSFLGLVWSCLEDEPWCWEDLQLHPWRLAAHCSSASLTKALHCSCSSLPARLGTRWNVSWALIFLWAKA